MGLGHFAELAAGEVEPSFIIKPLGLLTGGSNGPWVICVGVFWTGGTGIADWLICTGMSVFLPMVAGLICSRTGGLSEE